MAEEITKKCTCCGEVKPLDNFSKQKRGKLGLRASCKLCAKKYREENKKSISEYSKQYYQENKESILERHKQYYQENKEHYAQHYQENKKSISEYNKQYKRERRNNEPLYRLEHNIRSLIWHSIKNGGYTKKSKTCEILGCSYEDFEEHIESQFQEGMNWDNYGEWELDHIIPVSSHNNEEELIKLNYYTNFQPLWKEDNKGKGAIYIEEEKQRFLDSLK